MFDKATGNFIVWVKISPEVYSRIAHDEVIADMNSLVFEKEMGLFAAPVYMSPQEYGNYVKDQKLSSR